jgi:protein-disulfide isomerase
MNDLNENIKKEENAATSEISGNEIKKSFSFNFDKHFLPISILIAGVLISGSILYVSGGKSGINANKNENQANAGATGKIVEVSEDDDPFLGKDNAPIVMIEFSDYQCPFCRLFWRDTLPSIKKDYIDTGKVKFVYRDFPLSIHPAAQISAVAANCAGEQGKYWQYHDKIFSEQDKINRNGTVTYSRTELEKWARELGLNTQNFKSCLDSKKYDSEVAKDLNDGQAAGATGTPAFFINGRLVSGALPYASFKSILDEELQK